MGNNLKAINEKHLNSLLEKNGIKQETLLALRNRLLETFPNGVLKKEEFCKMYVEYYKSESVSKISERIFEVFDFDKDGQLNYKEVALLISMKQMNDMDRLSYIFDIFDKNSDGSINFEEYIEIIKFQALFNGKIVDINIYEEELRRIFQYMDKSGDKKISKKEFKDALTKDPSIFDLT